MKIVLYRILGNDIPNRHSPGQTLENLRFILENEPDHECLDKRWLLNRIVDHDYLERIRALIEEYDQRTDVIPFRPSEYAQCWCDVGRMPLENLPGEQGFQASPVSTRERINEFLRRSKSLYLVNNNGARNHALALGFNDNAHWVLPWDGGCFLSARSWQSIMSVMEDKRKLGYIAVPMARSERNEDVIDDRRKFKADIEPQLCFSRHSQLYFDPNLRYGSMPKSRLLQRLGVPGKWQTGVGHFPWETMDTRAAEDAGNFEQVGFVIRLSGDGEHQRLPEEAHRWVSRFKGTNQWTEKVDRALIARQLSHRHLLCWRALDQASPYAVTDFTSAATLSLCAQRALGIPSLYCPESRGEAGFQLSNLPGPDDRGLDGVVSVLGCLVLDEEINGNKTSAIFAVRLIGDWLGGDGSTATPDQTFIDFLAPRAANAGQINLALGLNGLYVLCDVLTLLVRKAYLEGEHLVRITRFMEEFFDWLIRSQEGVALSKRVDSAGTAYHLALLALGCFLRRETVVDNVLCSVPRLMARQFNGEGDQIAQGLNSDSQKLLNIELWGNIAILCNTLGRDLWSFVDSAGRGLSPVFYLHLYKLLSQQDTPSRNGSLQRMGIVASLVNFNNSLIGPVAGQWITGISAIPPYWQHCRKAQ